MKFDCDSKRDARKARRQRRRSARHLYFTCWHTWYAWFPVRVAKGDCRWLEPVERRGMGDYWGYTWEYRAPVEANS